MISLKFEVFMFLLIVPVFHIHVTGQDEIKIQRINGQVNLDGISDEIAWEGITPFHPVMQRPVFGKEPTERTEILIACDNDYLYVAGRLYDNEPDKIRATSYKRDINNASSEWFGIALDTYNDKENAMAFFTTPSGLRWDGNIYEGPGGISINTDWNTFWEVEATQNNEGWFAEFKIPFTSLRFQEKDGRISMGLISWRLIARKNEWVIFPSIPDNWPTSFYKISKAQDIYFEDIERKNPVYISPYGLYGREESQLLNEAGTSYVKNIDNNYEAGLDIKYGITSNLTFDGTVNTDFSQVEIDDQVISLDRFSVYLPEKRQFFLERSKNFDFIFNNSNQLFYSRKIGINADKPVRIYGGGRIVGRMGKTDIGILTMQTARLDSFPSENLGVLRLKRQVFNSNSYLGGITTTKVGVNGNYNIVYGLDGVFRLKGDDFLKVAIAQSVDKEIANNMFAGTLRYRIEMERRSSDKFSYAIGSSYVGRDYSPALGFEHWHDYKDINLKLQYSWLANDSSRLYRTTTSISPYIIWNNTDGKIDVCDINPYLNFNTKAGFQYTLINHISYENVRDSLTYLRQVVIPSGTYSFYYMEAELHTSDITPYKAFMNIKAGSFYDGRKISLVLQPTWNVSRHLEFEARYQFDRIDMPTRDQQALSHLLRLKTLFMLNTKLSVAAFVQYSNIEKLSISNIRLRYNPKEGNDLYIVYNHGFNTERYEVYPVLPPTNVWNISFKYIHTFIF